MSIDWQPLWEIIDSHQRFVLSSHVRPDADALGSELAMAQILRSLGKSVRIINPSAAPNTLEFLDPDREVAKLGEGVADADVLETDVHMVLDTSAWGQLAEVGDLLRQSAAIKVVIDHHASSDSLGAVEFKDVTCEATGSLVFALARSRQLELSPRVANLLYCAIATDTGWFRFPSTSGQTMRTIGQLIDFGAQPHLLYQVLYEQKSLARIRLAGLLLGRVTVQCAGLLAFTVVRLDDFKQTGATPVDTEDLVNECLTVSGVLAAFIAVEQENGRVKFSLRSRVPFNVAAVAEQFGGGGHHQAAGAMLDGPLEQAVEQVTSAFHAALSEKDWSTARPTLQIE